MEREEYLNHLVQWLAKKPLLSPRLRKALYKLVPDLAEREKQLLAVDKDNKL